MERKGLLRLAAVIAVVAVTVSFAGVRLSRGKMVSTAAVEQGEIVQTVVATGRVISVARVEIGSLATGTVRLLGAREGSRVRVGQLLVQLDDAEPVAALNQARGALLEAEARLRQLATLSRPVSEEALKQANTNLVLARADFSRTRRLFDDGFFSKARLDEAQRNLELAEAGVASARAQAESNRPSGSDMALALARRDQARASVASVRARLDYTRVRAPANGMLLQRFVETGDVVQSGKRLFLLAVEGETQLVVNVDEKNLGLIAVDQAALAAADAYPGRSFSAQIFYIASLVDIQRGTVEVKLRVPQPPGHLRSDMTVSVEIEVGRKKGASIVPSTAIRDAATAAPWVLALQDGRAVRRPVKLGLRGAGRTEIIEGVAPDELLVSTVDPGVADGDRIRARETGE